MECLPHRFRQTTWTLAACVLSAWGLTACVEEATGEEDALAEATLGWVRLDLGSANSNPADAVDVGVAFARYRGVNRDDVLQLLDRTGGGLPPGTDVGECAMAETRDKVADRSARVELLDIGHLAVDASGVEVEIVPRTFPELGSVLGAFYAESLDEIDDRRRWHIRAQGGSGIDEWEAVTLAPVPLENVHLRGRSGVVDRDRRLRLAWDAGNDRDFVHVTLVAGSTSVECLAHDQGVLRVEPAMLRTLEPDLDGKLVIRRVRIRPFAAGGADEAWVSTSTSATLNVQVR